MADKIPRFDEVLLDATPLALLSSPLCSEKPLELDLDLGMDLLFELVEVDDESGRVLLVLLANAFFTDLKIPPDSSDFSGFAQFSVGGMPRKSEVLDKKFQH